MNSREHGPGKIRRAKDRQEAYQIEAFGEQASSLLAAYAWSREEAVFLRLLQERKLSFADIKLLTWEQVVPDRNVLVLKGREHYLAPETGAAIAALLEETLEQESSGRAELLSSGTSLFSPETARSLRITLSRKE